MSVYFNDNEPYVAEWLRNLYPDAIVDSRSILDVKPEELSAYTRVHTFAGIGGWQLALDMAGWGETPVWTASLPCQPFSMAGKRRGEEDERHLWPVFRGLVEQSRPEYIFGEQVASKDGKVWLAGIQTDLEKLDYTFGAADLCAAGIGAPHIRQRLYWVAYAAIPRRAGAEDSGTGSHDASEGARGQQPERGSATGGVAHSQHDGYDRPRAVAALPSSNEPNERIHSGSASWDDFYVIECSDGRTRRVGTGVSPLVNGVPGRAPKLRAYGNAIVPPLAAEFISAFMDVANIPAQNHSSALQNGVK